MTPKLKCIMLIDDHGPTNYYHKIIISDANCTEKVIVAESGEKALELLTIIDSPPDLIFLDINMPRMNGWEFLKEYRNLEKKLQGETIIMMLTTSISPRDKEQLAKFPIVTAYKIKPLTVELLEEIIATTFSNTSPLT